MYSTQQTQNYTYGADAQGTYDANAQNSAYNNAYYQNAYYNNAQANPYNANYTIHRQHSSRLVQIIIIMTTRFPGMFLMRYL